MILVVVGDAGDIGGIMETTIKTLR